MQCSCSGAGEPGNEARCNVHVPEQGSLGMRLGATSSYGCYNHG